MKNKRIIVTGYGTASPEGIKDSIEPIEEAIRQAFSDYDVYRAFTGKRVRELLRDKHGISTDSPNEALERARYDGVDKIIIQPTHLSGGKEYSAMTETLGKYKDRFKKFIICPPLTDTLSDLESLAEILIRRAAGLPVHTAALYVGHGTEEGAFVYENLQRILLDKKANNIFISTLSEKNGVGLLAKKLSKSGYTHCRLFPLLIVTGRHADEDIGGSGSDSWLSLLNMSGIITDYQSESLGSLPEIHELFIKKIRTAAGMS